MEEGISIFKISKADATYENGNLTVNLYYPKSPVELNARLPGNSAFGAKALEKLLKEGHAEIASSEVPIKPADSGSIYRFSDNVVLVHRRRFPLGRNSIHNFYHSAPAGYTDELNATFSEEGLIKTGLRETEEEQIIVTRDRKKFQIVRKGSKEYALKTAKNVGIDLPILPIKMETLPSNDELNVFWEDGEPVFTSRGKGFLDFLWDTTTSISLMQVVSVPFPSSLIYPIDAEGITRDGKFIRFDRETYLIPLSEIANKQFGTPLKTFEVYQARIENGTPEVYTPEPTKPFYGPDEKIVTHPHIWAPEVHTTTCLDALRVSGFAGRRVAIQLWKERCVLNKESMIPREFLAG